MALMPKHESHHLLSPTDCSFKTDAPVMNIDVARTTNQTGEQFHVAIPVYASDSREEVKTRLNFALSIIQDRLEEENEAVEWLNERQNTMRMAQNVVTNTPKYLADGIKLIEKRVRQGKITQEEGEKQKTELREKLDKNLKLNQLLAKHAEEELKTKKEVPYPEELRGPQDTSLRDLREEYSIGMAADEATEVQ